MAELHDSIVAQVTPDVLRALLAQSEAAQPAEGWRPIESAPKEVAILALVEDYVRVVRWGKTSHVPIYGWCLADQGAEDFDLCQPTAWQFLPPPPAREPEAAPAEDAQPYKDALHDLVALKAQQDIGCVPAPTKEQWEKAWAEAEELARVEP